MADQTVKNQIKVLGIPEAINVTSVIPQNVRVSLTEPKPAKSKKSGPSAQRARN
jgi:flagellar biogenesis protein FliO